MEDITIIEGIRLAIPMDRECSYCHPTAKAPLGLHDIHSPILETACDRCHGNYSHEEARETRAPSYSRTRELMNRSLSYLSRKSVDISCGNCHGDLHRSFFQDNRTAWLAKLHMWAGSADNFIGPEGEIRYIKNFTNDMESNACLLCHVVEEVNIYKGEHTRITFRACTNESCHGNENTRGTKTFVAAGYLGITLASHQDAHSKGFLSSKLYRGWRMCVGCHEIHPKAPGLLSRAKQILRARG
jgi:hypothetical protein